MIIYVGRDFRRFQSNLTLKAVMQAILHTLILQISRRLNSLSPNVQLSSWGKNFSLCLVRIFLFHFMVVSALLLYNSSQARCSEGQELAKFQGAGSQVQWQDWQGKVSLACMCPTDETFYFFFSLQFLCSANWQPAQTVKLPEIWEGHPGPPSLSAEAPKSFFSELLLNQLF